MKYLLPLLLLPMLATAQNITATGNIHTSWTAPTTNSDGSPLTDLAGFKVYWGIDNACTAFPNSFDVTDPGTTDHDETFTITQTSSFCFVVTAYDTSGNESANSNTAEKTLVLAIDFPPLPPTNFQLDMTFNCVSDEVGLTCEATVQ